MRKISNLKKGLIGILMGGIALGSGYKINEEISGATVQDYIGGSNKIQTYEEGKEKDVEIKVYPIWEARPNHCSMYARKTTEQLGNEIVAGNAWDLPKRNENCEYSPEKLSIGDLVGFYNPKSKFNANEREYSHVATYLGKNKEGQEVYAEQRGINSRITTIQEFEKEGWKPRRIIKAKKAKI